ncbi:MAG: M23 family metallopeptidase [Oscillospiraceae bacterium]|nr:M23 family metallopeptidase [Oscillospiraceae bacterium]
MNNYVFKDEFADNLPPDVPETRENVTEQMPRGEGCLRLVFIQGVICALVVLSCLVLRYAAPKAYASIKTAYNNAVKTDDITFEDIKTFFSGLGNFVFSDEKQTNSSVSSNIPQNESSSSIAQSEGAGGSDVKAIPITVTTSAYIITSQISSPVTSGTVTSGFGWRVHPIFKTEGFHTGIDIASKLGTPITSAFSGVVYEVGQSEAYGNYVIMKHSDTLFTFYGHCDSIKVEKSMVIRAGEIIAYMGSTGYSTGPHLHFEIRINGKSVDPAYVLKGIDGIAF